MLLLPFAGVGRTMRRPLMAVVSLALAGFATPSIALADSALANPNETTATAASVTAPKPSARAKVAQNQPPGPGPGGPGGGPQTGRASQTTPFGHLPVIDILPTFTNPYPILSSAFFQSPLNNAGTGYSPIDIGGTFKLPITPIFSASFDRIVEGTLNVPSARVTTLDKKGATVSTIPSFSRDVVLVYRLDQNIKTFQIEEGLYFRHRAVGGASTSAQPFPNTVASTEAHYGYVGVTYATPRVPALHNAFLTFNINADAQAIDHHVGCGTATKVTSGNFSAPCIGGVYDPNPTQNRVWETDQYVQLTVPLDKTTTLTAQDKWGALNFYENAFFPYRGETTQTYVLQKRFTKFFAMSLRDKTQTYVAQGAPYIYPNAQHNGSFDVIADFKIDTNHL